MITTRHTTHVFKEVRVSVSYVTRSFSPGKKNPVIKCLCTLSKYCGEQCGGIEEICKHITSEHSELFPQKPERGNMCDICFKRFSSSNEVETHQKESHSPDSFYEQIKEDITGVCRNCKKKVSPIDIEDHFRTEHLQDNKYIKCSLCSQKFTSKKDLCSHTLATHRETFIKQDSKEIFDKEDGKVDADILIKDEK